MGAAPEQHVVPVEAQALLKQADTAYAAGERDLAQRLYRAVLVTDPNNTRAVFQLARLAPEGSKEAIALFQFYLAFQSSDPWGRMALGDALAEAGNVDMAIEQYHRAQRQVPDQPDAYSGLNRILRKTGRTGALIANCEDWVAHQPKNATAWLELGQARQQARRFPEAADAYAQSLTIKHDDHTQALLRNVLAESARSLRPYVARSTDTDNTQVTRLGLEGDWQFTRRAHLGLHAEHIDAKDPYTSATLDEYALMVQWQPLTPFKLDGLAGISRLNANPSGPSATTHPLRQLHLNWNSPADGPAFDFRFNQNPLIGTPGLVARPVDLLEVKGGVEWQVDSFRARLRGQGGRLTSATDVNHRSGFQIGPVYRWQPAAEVSLSYNELGYDHPSSVGYFAPRIVQSVELSTYLEYERLWPLSFVLDAGIGQQRVAIQTEAVGNWIATFHIWSQVTWTLKPGMRLELELEHDDSPLAGDATTPTANWSSNSVMLSLRFGIQPKSAHTYLAERTRRGGS